MQTSHVIEVSGQFAGAAVSHGSRFRFVAVDPRVDELDESVWASLADIHRVVGHLLTTGRLPAAIGRQPSSSDRVASAGLVEACGGG